MYATFSSLQEGLVKDETNLSNLSFYQFFQLLFFLKERIILVQTQPDGWTTVYAWRACGPPKVNPWHL